MSCITDSDLLDRYVDAELPARERALVEAHLAGCAACHEQVAGLEGLRRMLRREVLGPAHATDLSGLWPAIEARLGSGGTRPGMAGASAAVRPGVRRAVGRLRRALASGRYAGRIAASIAALLILAVALPLANLGAPLVDRRASVASLESGESAAVVLLAGSPTRPPVIWVTETAHRADEGSHL